MKTQKKAGEVKWMPGALALAAGASTAQAATVQITFENNVLTASSSSGYLDLTGDGGLDIYGSVVPQSTSGVPGVMLFLASGPRARGVAKYAVATQSYDGPPTSAKWFSVMVGTGNGYNESWEGGLDDQSQRALTTIRFTDARINDGDYTTGFLDITAMSGSSGTSIQIHRLIFDDTSTSLPDFTEIPGAQTESEWSAVSAVPEASTSLGLLALGAGGLLTRRRMKRAA